MRRAFASIRIAISLFHGVGRHRHRAAEIATATAIRTQSARLRT
jgi:hypothetical protein